MTKIIQRLPQLIILSLTLAAFNICCFIPVLANSSRQLPRVTISATNMPLGDIFRKIYQQTGYQINNNTFETHLNEDTKITVNFVQTGLNEVMTFLLGEDSDLSFVMGKHSIQVLRKSYPAKTDIFRYTPKNDTTGGPVEVLGKVVDNSGNPVPGATIKEKNNRHGTISNTDGTFRLTNISKGTSIVVSSIGFESKEIIAENKNDIIQLNPHTNVLDEKLVIAYGITTKRLSTGNVSSIKAIDIEKQPVGNPLLAVEGRIAGIYIQQSSGLPGTGVTVRIQGMNSLHSGNDPFYVVDGVPYISQLLPTNNPIGGNSGVSTVYGNPLNYINTADIESIEVLKDADATAIYGSRAANGAVLITTKKGKSGELKTNVKFQSGWAKTGKELSTLNTKEYLEMRHEALKNDGISTPTPFDWDLNGTWDTIRNVNWQKELIGRTSQFTDIQADVSGGNSTTQFLLGAGYHKEGTVFPGNFSDTKGSVHLNLNGNSKNQKFKAQLTSSFLIDNNKLPTSDLTRSAFLLAPIAPNPYNKDGSLNWAPDSTGASTYYYNPLAPLGQQSTNKTTNLISNATFSYEVYPNLVIKTAFGYTNLITNEILKSPLSINVPELLPYSTAASQFITNRVNSWLIEPQIEFKHNLLRGDITALIGSTISQTNSDQSSIIASGFNNDLVLEDLGSATRITGATINAVYKYNALFGRITYNWSNKYIINFNARRDGSSRFGSENRFHNFGSVAGAWIFSEEQFARSIVSILSFGKLRLSYGTTGNDQIPDYQFIDLYQAVSISGPAYQNAMGLSPARITNPYLQWEETKKLQMGLDLGFINDRILMTVNYNRNRSGNQLSGFRLPFITGFSSITRNFPAVIQNTGWEFTLNTTNIKTKYFTWSSGFNLTIPKNQLHSYFGLDKNQLFQLGKPINISTYFNYAGVDNTTGNYQYKDVKGDVTLTPSDPADRYIIVSPDPKFYGGLLNSISYKGISLDIFLQFAKKSTIDYITYGLDNTYPGIFNYGMGNQSIAVLNRWQNPGDNATHQPFSSNGSKDLATLSNSNAIWTDASFIKLRNITLSWELPTRWKKPIHFQSAKVFLNAQNVLTLTNYRGLDPENPGLSLPPLRLITIGAQISL